MHCASSLKCCDKSEGRESGQKGLCKAVSCDLKMRCKDLKKLKSAVDIVPYPNILVKAASRKKRLADGGLHSCYLTVMER